MTLDEFYDALTACREQFTWYLHGTDLRATDPHREDHEEVFCPVTAVAYTVLGEYWHEVDALNGVHRLTLEYDLASAIICCADLDLEAYEDPAMMQGIRARLLECVGLDAEVTHA